MKVASLALVAAPAVTALNFGGVKAAAPKGLQLPSAPSLPDVPVAAVGAVGEVYVIVLLESFGERVGRPDETVIVPRHEDKVTTGTLAVELDLVGGEDAGLPGRLAVVMAHDRPF